MNKQEQRKQSRPKNESERRAEAGESFELELPEGTDVSTIRVEVGALNDINFGF